MFDFVTDPTITDHNIDEYLEKAQDKAITRGTTIDTPEEEISKAVFKNIFIPRTLHEVADYEKDYCQMQSGEQTDIAYHTITGLRRDLSGAQILPEFLKLKSDYEYSSEESTESPASSSMYINL